MATIQSLLDQLSEQQQRLRHSVKCDMQAISELQSNINSNNEQIAENERTINQLEQVTASYENVRKVPSYQEWAAKLEREWHPVETAPKDGTWIILISNHVLEHSRPAIGKWNEQKCEWDGFMRYGTRSLQNPTHWMPLPKPPKEE